MGEPVIIYGKSGSGKSRSLKNFGEKEILFINVEGKRLPFQSKFEYTMKTASVPAIIGKLKAMPCKVGVIDDAGYLMTKHFMKHHRNKAGNASFEMYDEIADIMYHLVEDIKTELPDDVIVYILMHEDKNDYGETSLLTLGKLLDRKVNLIGMVTIALRCMSESGKHFFRTNTDGSDISKSPEGMFDLEIENDLKAVDTAIRRYYGFEEEDNG